MTKSSMRFTASKEWDRSIIEGDLVCLTQDRNIPHIYQVTEVVPRMLMDHHFYLHEGLEKTGKKPGDDVAPAIKILRVREAPGYQLLPSRKTLARTVDAWNLVKVTLEQIDFVTKNLEDMAAYIKSRQ